VDFAHALGKIDAIVFGFGHADIGAGCQGIIFFRDFLQGGHFAQAGDIAIFAILAEFGREPFSFPGDEALCFQFGDFVVELRRDLFFVAL